MHSQEIQFRSSVTEEMYDRNAAGGLSLLRAQCARPKNKSQLNSRKLSLYSHTDVQLEEIGFALAILDKAV